jgi:hypothetical protein
LVRKESSNLLIELDDLLSYGEVQLAENVRQHAKRYERLFYKVGHHIYFPPAILLTDLLGGC